MRMYQEYTYQSCGAGKINVSKWVPEQEICGIVQIIHGIAEYSRRYDDFARFLNAQGFLVVAEDHMGHGKSVDETLGYFNGGWFSAVDDTYRLMKDTMKEYPDVPYILFGHSMGSFMARTILIKYPDCGIAGAIICGTGWQPTAVLKSGIAISKAVCKLTDRKKPNMMLQKLMFGFYNAHVEHPRTEYDWLTRWESCVDAYVADPLCGFIPTAGLAQDMLCGIDFIQIKDNISKMNKSLPVFFVAGGEDPVGNYGAGVRKTAEMFEKTGMERVATKIYPLCRHEILNEINKNEVYEDLLNWMKNI